MRVAARTVYYRYARTAQKQCSKAAARHHREDHTKGHVRSIFCKLSRKANLKTQNKLELYSELFGCLFFPNKPQLIIRKSGPKGKKVSGEEYG
jgi:hypothetical protein